MINMSNLKCRKIIKNESNLKCRKLNSDQESKEWNEENG